MEENRETVESRLSSIEGMIQRLTVAWDPTHEATTPPDNGEVDQEAVEKAEEQLQQPGGGH